MRRCLACNTIYDSSQKKCLTCGAGSAIVDSFDAYAPDLARHGGGFNASYFSDLFRIEENHFWFRARNEIIIWALNKYIPHMKSFLEIGCGTGYVLTGIARIFSQATLSGSEIFTEGLGFAKKRLPSVNLMQMDARVIPFHEEFDAIGAFDVLEHIKEDDLVLTQIYNALKHGGIMLVTVPQHAWLWSEVDDYALHERRYAAKELHGKIQKAGFRIFRSTSFVTSLLPAMMISRLLRIRKTENFDAYTEVQVAPLLNSLFYRMLNIELLAIKLGMNLSLGGSRLVVARKA